MAKTAHVVARTRVCEVGTRGIQVSPNSRLVTDVITAHCSERVEDPTRRGWWCRAIGFSDTFRARTIHPAASC
ncbi:MAG: hypothetical protein ACRDQG_04485 [Pseudonocardiaceae bacterium]